MKPQGEYISRSEEQTLLWGKTLGENLRPQEAVFLIGKLGTGKSVIARGIARGLNWLQPVNSPSFSLVKLYRAELNIYHCDLYRLKLGDDITQLGLEELMEAENSVSIFEWSEQFPVARYIPRWEVTIADGETDQERIIKWSKIE